MGVYSRASVTLRGRRGSPAMLSVPLHLSALQGSGVSSICPRMSPRPICTLSSYCMGFDGAGRKNCLKISEKPAVGSVNDSK